MNSSEICKVISEIANTASKNDKQAIIALHKNDAEFVKVLDAALNPYYTYGIKKRPSPAYFPAHNPLSLIKDLDMDEQSWNLLEDLRSRKQTGMIAIDSVALELGRLNEASAELFWRIIIKDLKAGFGESTVNKVIKGLIKDFPYMRCALPKDTDLAEWPWLEGVLSQEKADGMFANLDYEECGLIRLTSRQGSEFPIDSFEALTAEVKSCLNKGSQYHGELIVRKKDGTTLERQAGNGMLNSVIEGGSFEDGCYPVYQVWDEIPLTSVVTKGKYEVGYKERFKGIVTSVMRSDGGSIQMIPTKIVRSMAEAFTHYRELLKAGKEGTVIKHPKAIWRDGTSKEQIKLKLEVDVDLKVVAIVEGNENGRNAGRPGSLKCQTSCGQLVVDVAVKNEAMRDSVEANPDNWIDKVIAVRANMILEPSESNELNSLFLPRMIEANYRNDKSEADSLQRVRDQFASAIAA